MEELISKKKLLADLNGIREVLSGQGDPFLASVLTRAIQCVEKQPVVLVDLVKEDGNGFSVSGV